MRIALALVLAASPLFAQEEVEVRRALPVEPESYQNPAWMGLVEPEIRRAEPVNPPPQVDPTPVEPVPLDIPALDPGVPVAPAVPASTPPAEPMPERVAEPVAIPAPAPDAPGGIRIAPTTPADEAGTTLERANNFYARKLHEPAIPEYEKFLILETTGDRRAEALFRLAECHRLAGNPAAARSAYEMLVMEFQSGEFAAAGAYRLGGILFEEKLLEPASLQFDLAAREAAQPEVRLAATYFAARSLDALGKPDSAAKRYEEVLETPGDNPYLENAAMALGAIQLRLGKTRAALETYEKLSASASSPGVSASAALQAAKLAAESNFHVKALELFDLAAAKAPDSKTKSDALLSALRLRYSRKDHEGILKHAASIEEAVPPSSRAEVLQILAASQRQSGKDADARATYDRLVAEHPEAATAEILYQRLLALYALKDAALVAEADRFLATTGDAKQKAAVALLKAEALFQASDHAPAARAYEVLLENKWLEPSQRSAALYKFAWCLAAAGDSPRAIEAYTEFLAKHPNDKLAATALLQRGLARQKAKDHEGAIADFDQVLAEYAMSKEVEIALLQKALTCGHLKKYTEMSGAFTELLKKYPKSAAAAQANFWLGWAAYENRDFKESVRYLERARELDAKNYGDRATLRIVLAHYQLENRTAALREVEKHKGAPLPPEIPVWLAEGLVEDGKAARAVPLLQPLLENPEAAPPPGALLLMSRARHGTGEFEAASTMADTYLAAVSEPSAQARGHIAKARAEAGLGNFPAARQAVEQAFFLQPEGRINSEARLASGEVFFDEGDFDSAARAFLSVSVLSDDPDLAKKALTRAAESYRQAGNTEEAEKTQRELIQRFPQS
jgi:cellulose synthase operon protein C